MKKTVLPGLCLAAAFALVGCTTTQVDPSVAEAVTSKVSQECPADPFYKITVVRDTGTNGGAVDTIVYLDGTEAARLRTGQKVSMCVDASDSHYVNIDCWGCMPHTIEVKPAANVEKIIRTGFYQGGMFAVPHAKRPIK